LNWDDLKGSLLLALAIIVPYCHLLPGKGGITCQGVGGLILEIRLDGRCRLLSHTLDLIRLCSYHRSVYWFDCMTTEHSISGAMATIHFSFKLNFLFLLLLFYRMQNIFVFKIIVHFYKTYDILNIIYNDFIKKKCLLLNSHINYQFIKINLLKLWIYYYNLDISRKILDIRIWLFFSQKNWQINHLQRRTNIIKKMHQI
jgi:hypothetical protein